MTRVLKCFAIGALGLAAAGCQFSPTAPFRGFDNRGSRIVGQFASGDGASAQSALHAASASSGNVGGIVVSVRERPALKVTVDQGGGFALAGLPSGSFTLVFMRDGETLGEIRLRFVRKNQGIRITVILTPIDEVVLVDEERDAVSFSGECPRGPGFWCQNQRGQNPNLSTTEFDAFADEAAELLKDVPALDTRDEVAAAVCDTSDQFTRQLATLALNLAAETVQLETPLLGEQPPYATVGDAFEAALAHLTGVDRLSGSEREALKDVMDRINNAQNVAECDQLPDDDDSDPTTPDDGSDEPEEDAPASGTMTICHIPPGNYNARHTITIGASAWPAHRGHCAQGTCDYQGACR